MKTAIFSNGFKDTYKGSRAVTAAWMVTEIATGKVIASGHSLSPENAEKTARGAIPRPCCLPSGWASLRNSVHMHQYARKIGYADPAAMADDYKMKNAEHAKQYKVEVVSI